MAVNGLKFLNRPCHKLLPFSFNKSIESDSVQEIFKREFFADDDPDMVTLARYHHH